jgi:hypothetical protein
MPKNPFTDVWQFLTGQTEDYLALGGWRYLVVALFFALLAISVVAAVRNWKEDPAQRTAVHAGMCLPRLDHMHVVRGHAVEAAATGRKRLQFGPSRWRPARRSPSTAFVTDVLLPNLHLLGPIVFLAELTFAGVARHSRIGRAPHQRARDLVRAAPLAGIYIPGAPASGRGPTSSWRWCCSCLRCMAPRPASMHGCAACRPCADGMCRP